jgi:L-alanine-DL-glutamate epimerase-like enolase superfamily enzyme
MKISGLELFRICVSMAKPYHLSKVLGTRNETQAIILKIHTDDGLVGLGEANPSLLVAGESPAGVMVMFKEYLGPMLLGADPLAMSQLEIALDSAISGNYASKGAVGMALYDIAGQAWGVPVHTLFGGKLVSELPMLWPLGSGSPADDISAMEEKLAQGFKTYMLKMGSLPIKQEIERVKAVRERFGPEVKLVADANQGWEVYETLEFITGLQGTKLELIEQPLRREDWEGLRRIRALCSWPISADEGLVSIHDARNLIERQAVDVFSLKVSKNGGLIRTKKMAVLAEAYDLTCLMNSELEFGITQAALLHVGCTLSNLVDIGHAYMSPLRLADDVTDYARLVDRGRVRVPESPGLGVSLDHNKLERYTKDYLKIG